MATKGDAGVVDNALVNRCRHHPIERTIKAALGGYSQGFQNIGAIRRIQLAGRSGRQSINGKHGEPARFSSGWCSRRPVFQLYIQPKQSGPRLQQRFAGHHHNAGPAFFQGQLQAKLRANARRFARCQCEDDRLCHDSLSAP